MRRRLHVLAAIIAAAIAGSIITAVGMQRTSHCIETECYAR